MVFFYHKNVLDFSQTVSVAVVLDVIVWFWKQSVRFDDHLLWQRQAKYIGIV